LNFIDAKDNYVLYKKFIAETNKLNEIRQENFWEIFPELATVLKYGNS
jgi:hypothetical protein